MVDTGKPYVVASIVTDIVFRKNVGVIIKLGVTCIDPPLCESAPKRDPTSDRPQLVDTLKEIFVLGGVPMSADRDPHVWCVLRRFQLLAAVWPGSCFGADSQTDPPFLGGRTRRNQHQDE